MAAQPDRLNIEVVYATARQQDLVRVGLATGATAIAAVRASGLLDRHPEIDAVHARIGVFGRIVAPDTPLADGDRVEIYRPLFVDPKLARRARAGAR